MTYILQADFNGVFGEILCLSHGDASTDVHGAIIRLETGMVVVAYAEDLDDQGIRDDVIAGGVVEPAPEWLASHGSRWVVRIDEHGIRHQSDLEPSEAIAELPYPRRRGR